ncbi:hypothetical protein BC828DRAFT_383008 [Blastocladiella britannica]|nr:hypothetical protein BC828DRAFT_383008 [Blastocladiella britannica]
MQKPTNDATAAPAAAQERVPSVDLIRMACEWLRLPPTTTATALMHYHRVDRFRRDPGAGRRYPEIRTFDSHLLALGAVFVATKATDHPRKVRDLINAAHVYGEASCLPFIFQLTRKKNHSILNPEAPHLSVDSSFWKYKHALVVAESLVLRIIKFRLTVPLAFAPAIDLVRGLFSIHPSTPSLVVPTVEAPSLDSVPHPAELTGGGGGGEGHHHHGGSASVSVSGSSSNQRRGEQHRDSRNGRRRRTRDRRDDRGYRDDRRGGNDYDDRSRSSRRRDRRGRSRSRSPIRDRDDRRDDRRGNAHYRNGSHRSRSRDRQDDRHRPRHDDHRTRSRSRSVSLSPPPPPPLVANHSSSSPTTIEPAPVVITYPSPDSAEMVDPIRQMTALYVAPLLVSRAAAAVADATWALLTDAYLRGSVVKFDRFDLATAAVALALHLVPDLSEAAAASAAAATTGDATLPWVSSNVLDAPVSRMCVMAGRDLVKVNEAMAWLVETQTEHAARRSGTPTTVVLRGILPIAAAGTSDARRRTAGNSGLGPGPTST